eukprot:CAMPEP_0119315346 /NCGR_PEP_ID=MMETSP1333-20130426/35452_1 /TAXON_ID=418940 /ORGANISM="Scyphosphaera apsteinii, Strain RCC1455" /LENGTH=315 /DNA_ID=CAMNT_0007320677 /DNA_START=140 /DNA_END=1087 /DNA_ORIENTATION=+
MELELRKPLGLLFKTGWLFTLNDTPVHPEQENDLAVSELLSNSSSDQPGDHHAHNDIKFKLRLVANKYVSSDSSYVFDEAIASFKSPNTASAKSATSAALAIVVPAGGTTPSTVSGHSSSHTKRARSRQSNKRENGKERKTSSNQGSKQGVIKEQNEDNVVKAGGKRVRLKWQGRNELTLVKRVVTASLEQDGKRCEDIDKLLTEEGWKNSSGKPWNGDGCVVARILYNNGVRPKTSKKVVEAKIKHLMASVPFASFEQERDMSTSSEGGASNSTRNTDSTTHDMPVHSPASDARGRPTVRLTSDGSHAQDAQEI